jgi:quercetin dioxygenase-like cupin family protein
MRAVGKGRSALVLAGVLVVAGCSSGRPVQPVAAVGVRTDDLAGGRLDSLPTGPLFMRVQSFAQPAGSDFGSRTHQPGFEYQIGGSQLLEINGGPTITIQAGQSYFQPSVAHTHRNPGPDANSWLFCALWPSSVRTAPQVTPSAKVAYESEDISPAGLPSGPYAENLQLVHLDTGGHTAPHRRSGLQTLFVLSGQLRVETRSGSSVLRPFDGTYLAPGTTLEVVSAGQGPSEALVFTVTPVGEPFEVSLPGL